MLAIETRKYYIISQVMQFNNDQIIGMLETFLASLVMQSQFPEIFKPLKKNLDIDSMKNLQNYKGVNKEDFFAQANELEIKESLSELLAIV